MAETNHFERKLSFHVKSVAVIGGGPSGLCALRHLVEAGYSVTLFESNDCLGGLWRENKSNNEYSNSKWNSLRTNISKHTCSFNECQADPNGSVFPTQMEMTAYFKRYIEQFNLLPYCKLNCKVTEIKSSHHYDEGYIVSWTESNEQDDTLHFVHQKYFHFVIVCTGFFSIPTKPNVDLSQYSGKITHSSDYISSEGCSKRVAVIGSSHSACEIAAEIAANNHTKVYHISPHRVWALPRYLPLNPSSKASPMLPLDLLFYCINDAQFEMINKLNHQSESFDHKNHYIERVFRDEENLKNWKKYLSSLVEPNIPMKEVELDPAYVSISDSYNTMLKSGFIECIHGRVIGGEGHHLHIARNDAIKKHDQHHHQQQQSHYQQLRVLEDVDEIIFCSGYNPDFSFLEEAILSTLEYRADDSYLPLLLYRDIFHPKYKHLYFVGMYRGPFMPTIEQQAVLATNLIRQTVDFPSHEEMMKGLELSRTIRHQPHKQQFPHGDFIGHTVDYALGAKTLPTMEFLKKHPVVIASHFHPDHSQQMIDQINEVEADVEKFKNGYQIPVVILLQLEGLWVTDSDNAQKISFKRQGDNSDMCHAQDLYLDGEVPAIHPMKTLYRYDSESDALLVIENSEIQYCLQFKPSEEGWIASDSKNGVTVDYCVAFGGACINSISIKKTIVDSDLSEHVILHRA